MFPSTSPAASSNHIVPSVHGKLTLGDHQMVRLMVTTRNHDTHEAECFEFGDLFGIATRYGQLYAVWQVIGPGIPAYFG